MSYFADLTQHTYTPTYGKTVLNVGWLDDAYPFARGKTSPAFRNALQRLCQNPVELHRGFHYCQFCPQKALYTWQRLHPERLGNGQIRVKAADGVWYAAPVMIHHYVTEHQYLPPAPFIEAVLRQAEALDVISEQQMTPKDGENDSARCRFPSETLDALDKAKIIGVRAGTEYRYTGVWVVVVERRVFARSWNDKPTGWFRAFRAQPLGSLQFGDQEVKVRVKPIRSARLREAVSAAYARKYNTKASQKWVDGFAQPERSVNTVEFVPA